MKRQASRECAREWVLSHLLTSDTEKAVKTYRYRVKDKHAARLNRMARAVSFVWNFCNETQRTAVQRGDRWPTHFGLTHLVAGTSKELGVPATSIEATCKRYVVSRRGSRRRWLRFRGRKSLGWIPFRSQDVRFADGGFRFAGTVFRHWEDRPVPVDAEILDGSSFSADARGRWYLNVVVQIPKAEASPSMSAVGIDLGLKSLVTLSTGESIGAPQHFRRGAERLGMAQRARKPRLRRTLQAKIANQRRDFLHKLSTRLVQEHGAIYVGNVSSSRLAKTSFAKSVLDAGWSTLRRFLAYKSDYASVEYREVDEYGSTQLCSECGSLGGPRGRKQLVVRAWACGTCGVIHDRDVNAARNILRFGREALTGARVA